MAAKARVAAVAQPVGIANGHPPPERWCDRDVIARPRGEIESDVVRIRLVVGLAVGLKNPVAELVTQKYGELVVADRKSAASPL